jgi:hypothetical protein
MAKTYQYCVAENWGKGFIDFDESHRITFVGYPGNVWQVPAYNKHANLWIAKVAGTLKTKDEAQTIVTAEVKKYKIERSVELPKSMKAWKKLLDQHHSGIMVDVHAKTGELMFVILDLGL